MEEKKAETEPAAPPKKKKINKMTLAEIDAKLEYVKEKMGGLNSKYAQQLLQRKKTLTSWLSQIKQVIQPSITITSNTKYSNFKQALRIL